MLCEMCQKNEATVELTEVVGESPRTMHVCASCAAQKPIDPSGQLTLSDFLVSLHAAEGKGSQMSEATCPECHMRKSDFRQSSLLGCPSCYDAFADDLAPMLRHMHRGVTHVGKVPARTQLSGRMVALSRRLETAVSRQDFEGAASLRDEIAELQRALDEAGGAVPRET